jgi:integrase
MEHGYEKNKGTDNYILANDCSSLRITIAKKLSDSFTKLFRIVNPNKHLTIKCLRKTYTTKLENKIGLERASKSQGHKEVGTTKKHYINYIGSLPSVEEFSCVF